MEFDPENHVNKLCAQGMLLEGEGKPEEAAKLFTRAWNEATNDREKFTAAHYVARHQNTVADKLYWDTTALQFAQRIDSPEVKAVLPSLYLNIAKGHEDLADFNNARKNYDLALAHAQFLPADGYGDMIRSGITRGLTRVKDATR
ncbi:lysozyme family protein [Mucilaginibacter ginkgonis]|uniref:Uncharacterized protein n=1 Tax=Mucilaginibacter ginkgonis TaxID=2682091 RepID=A0A6I4INL9_9SPHI|nr:rRNA adenine methyltransferase [Mucilaginibacter ginkgonis]QQL49757.1 hypothetical protein GO620_016555 [Mucilaginibacter ginkgonis]